jgi:cephalosporin hydroxylase
MSPLKRVTRAIVHEVKTLRGAFYRRAYLRGDDERTIVEAFHRLYFDARAFNMTWRNTFWLGNPILKCPLDLWLYQEMLHEVKPQLIVETGTGFGGSALYLASLCDIMGTGEIVTIDVEKRDRPAHPRITYITGSSTAPEVRDEVVARGRSRDRVLVLLDSDHRKDHVLAEMRTYAPFVTPSSYMVVEDTNLNGHPVEPAFGPGPMEAVEAFLREDKRFAIDESKNKFFLSFNPRGYLKRVG